MSEVDDVVAPPARAPGRLARARAALSAATTPGRPPPPPSAPRRAQIVWGMAQPLLGLRQLFADRTLRRFMFSPAVALLVVCSMWTRAKGYTFDQAKFWEVFYTTFAALAVVPAILFADHYSELAATARARFGLGTPQPRSEGIRVAANRAVLQSLCVSFPATLLVLAMMFIVAIAGAQVGQKAILNALFNGTGTGDAMPWVRGAFLVFFIPWAAQWIVVDALDAARVLRADGTASDAGAEARPPRLARALRWVGIGFLMQRWSRNWWEEFSLTERRPWIALGFMATTALLLITPGVQFVFRPAIILAAAHWLGHLEASDMSPQATASGEPSLSAPVMPPGSDAARHQSLADPDSGSP